MDCKKCKLQMTVTGYRDTPQGMIYTWKCEKCGRTEQTQEKK